MRRPPRSVCSPTTTTPTATASSRYRRACGTLGGAGEQHTSRRIAERRRRCMRRAAAACGSCLFVRRLLVCAAAARPCGGCLSVRRLLTCAVPRWGASVGCLGGVQPGTPRPCERLAEGRQPLDTRAMKAALPLHRVHLSGRRAGCRWSCNVTTTNTKRTNPCCLFALQHRRWHRQGPCRSGGRRRYRLRVFRRGRCCGRAAAGAEA